MNCQICNKHFSRMSNLYKHQRTSKCSNATQCQNCHMHYVSLTKHYPDCVIALRNEITQLKLDNERYLSRIMILQNKVENNEELHQQMKELTKKVEEKKQEQVIHIHNHNNIKIQNLQILNTNEFDTFSEFLTIDHIKKGAYGYAEYAINYPLNNKIVCTDFSRRKLKYKSDDGEVKNDINLISLSKDLFKSINLRNKELIFEYAREYIETLNDPEEKMNAYVKFMNYISLIRDGSQGIHHELYTDFVKQICTLSNNT
jgi:hypothetical protein